MGTKDPRSIHQPAQESAATRCRRGLVCLGLAALFSVLFCPRRVRRGGLARRTPHAHTVARSMGGATAQQAIGFA